MAPARAATLLLAALLMAAGPVACCREGEKPATASLPDVVGAAKQVAAARFAGFKYGSRQDQGQLNCVQFTGAVTESLIKRSLTKEETDALYIRYSFENLDAAVAGEDPRTKGIQRALTEFVKQGTAIDLPNVQSGDFVQYWIKGKDGKWAGHSAIVTKVFTDAAGPAAIAIYSSNKSTDGIAEMDFGGQGLSLRKPDRKFYFVRFNRREAGL